MQSTTCSLHLVSHELMTLARSTGAKTHIPSHIYQNANYLALRITPDTDFEFMRFTWERSNKRGPILRGQALFSMKEGVEGLRKRSSIYCLTTRRTIYAGV